MNTAASLWPIVRRTSGFLFLICVAGCGGPKMYPVHGKVCYPDGSPMKGGSVMFEPVDNSLKVMARGLINNEDGTFRLTTEKDGDGAMEGRYRVMVRGRMQKPKSTVDDPDLDGQLHPRFLDFKTSGLEFTVEPKSNDFTITVEKAPKSRG